jgi:protein SCO1/2
VAGVKGSKTLLIVILGIALVVLYLTVRGAMATGGVEHGPAAADCLMITLVIALLLLNQKRKKKDTPTSVSSDFEGEIEKSGGLFKWGMAALAVVVISLIIAVVAGRTPSTENPTTTSWFSATNAAVNAATNAAVRVINQPVLPEISTINSFSLTNQFGTKITLNDLKGRPWLADIIFTRCPTVCPRMTQSLGELRAKLPTTLRYVSITTDPAHDTPAVMRAFAEAHGSNDANWHFLTGAKADLMRLAIDDLKLISVPKEESKRDNPNDLFVHSSLYILVDANGRVRKSFEHDATNLLQQVQATLKQLEAENDR